ncbi:MAG: hydrogenase maturation protease [Desulfobulbaceae bacterium]|nr:hydrogenase maturation protease [Desulfobulbaceae bacterium]
MRTIIIGLGNPLLSDDGLGLQAAALLRQRLGGAAQIEVIEAYTGGLELMELMVGYELAVVVDAVTSGCHQPGTLVELGLDDLRSSRNTSSTHDASLAVALETGKALGLKLPGALFFFGIEAGNAKDFGEKLTPQVNESLPLLVERVLMTLAREATP